MKKIELAKETMRVLNEDEAAKVAGGREDAAKQARPGQTRNDDNTRRPCATFPVAICVTGRC